MNERQPRAGATVLSAFVDALSFEQAEDRIIAWARSRESRYVCICNAHVLVMGQRDPTYRAVLEGADMATPDGAPVAWMLRRLGFPEQQRVAGPDLTERLLDRAEREGVPVFLLGSTPETLERLGRALAVHHPRLLLAGMVSPPFRPMMPGEDAALVERIQNAAPGIVFVGLGCPKQERWMADHRGRISAVMIGVGAAFDFLAGTSRRAPVWMRRAGLEWLHRLAAEPGRLWRRYAVTNTLFLVGAARQLFRLGR